MALKTKKNKASVTKFIDSVPNAERRKDAKVLVKLYADVTGQKPTMWGTAIIGFGMYTYHTKGSTKKQDMALAGFSPRKQGLTLYLFDGDAKRYAALLNHLGPHGTSRACLYLTRLADVNLTVLRQLIAKSYKEAKKRLT